MDKAAKRPMNPSSLANLRPPWKKGESGTPLGKQTIGPRITPVLRRYADLQVFELYRLPIHTLTLAEAMAAAIWMLSLQEQGDRARQMILDRLDGPLPKPTEVNDNRIQVLIRQLGAVDIDQLA